MSARSWFLCFVLFLVGVASVLFSPQIAFAQSACSTSVANSNCPSGRSVCSGEVNSNGICDVSGSADCTCVTEQSSQPATPPQSSPAPATQTSPAPSTQPANTTTTTTPSGSPSPAPNPNDSKVTIPGAEALNDTNYDYLKHGQTSLEGSVGHAAMCVIAGYSPLSKCIGYTWAGGVFGKSIFGANAGGSVKPMVYERLPSGGAFGSVGMIASTVYSSPPTSSMYYLAKVGNQFGVVPETAYAQVVGSGQNIIAPVEKLWRMTRNTAYLFFVIIFMVVGLMVMFRKSIDARTVVTVQQALPKLVVGMILVYFSYFIAALIVDIAFFGVALIAQLFLLSGAPNAIPNIKEASENSNIFMLYAGAGAGGVGTIFDSVQGQFQSTFGPGGSILAPAAAGAMAGAILGFGLPGAIIGGFLGAGAQYIVPVILIVIVLTALFIQVLRLTFALIMAYIQLLVLTIVGPFLIMFGSIPGQKSGLDFWLRGLTANSLIFPAIFAAVLFAGMILGDTSKITVAPPLLGGIGINSDLLRVMIAYGIILGSPAIPDMIRKQLKFSMDAAITNEAMGAFKSSQGLLTNTVGASAGRFGVNSLYAATAGAGNNWLTRNFSRNLNNRIGRKYQDSKWFSGYKGPNENPNRTSNSQRTIDTYDGTAI